MGQRWLGSAKSVMGRRCRRSLLSVCLIAGTALGTVLGRPGASAERIIVTYGFFERTIAVADLAEFAETGQLSRQLASYARALELSDADLAQIRQVLTESVDLSEVAVAQFLYTRQGESLLSTVGEIVQTPTRRSGLLAVRAALILAAADDTNGLTPINILEKFPNPSIRLDVGRALSLAREVGNTINRADQAVTQVRALAEAAAAAQTKDVTNTANQLVRDAPPYESSRYPLSLSRRGIEAELHLPATRQYGPALPATVPLIVISHGLGDDRTSYRYLATYLTRRGFAVAMLDHPGSNDKQIEKLLEGISQNVVETREFLNRPNDISALLDAVQRFAATQPRWRDRLDVQNAGIVGQSFGGYTALAVGGAVLNLDTLNADCQPQLIYLNPSLLLQCQANELPERELRLRDERIRAVLAVNPIGSALFGPEGYGEIDVPVMLVGGVVDTVAPALPEQIRPFTWLQTPERYLVVISNATHFSVIDTHPDASGSIPVPEPVIGPAPELAQNYLQVLSFGFFQRHLRQDDRYETVLSARYLQESLSASPLRPLSLVRDLSPEALQQAVRN